MAGETPYTRFDKNDLILRDELAIDRTILANERTFLAYLRTALALFIAGVSIIHFSHDGWFFWFGAVCVPAGIITGLIGLRRFRKMKRAIAEARKHSPKQQTDI